VRGKVVAMLGLCWSPEALHDLVAECEWLLIFETHASVARELDQFSYPSAVRILEFDMGAGALAWNYFFPGKPVPPLLRAIEDAELGRCALRDATLFADGFERGDFFEPPRGECQSNDAAFEEFELRLDGGGRSTINQAIEEGISHGPAIAQQCSEATTRYTVRTLRAFPAWRCAFLELPPLYAGRVAEHLANELASKEGGTAGHRSFAAVFEATKRRVRVVLRSTSNGPDVSEIAALYDGCGHPTRGFFSVPPDAWDELWVQPETILWDTEANNPHCLRLKRGEHVIVARRGERFRDSPFDEWSWGYKSADASMEGWIPTLAHTLLVATRSVPSNAQGIMDVNEGDLLVAQGQRGKYLWGCRLQPRFGREGPKGWFPHIDNTWQPVHASSVQALFTAGCLKYGFLRDTVQ